MSSFVGAQSKWYFDGYLGVNDSKFTYILKKINELLYSPNFSNPANITLSALRNKDE
jgi:hypothetical protein